MDYDLACDIWSIYRHLYKGEGADCLAQEFTETAIKIYTRNLHCDDLYYECIDDMTYCKGEPIKGIEETWLLNTFDCIEIIVEKFHRIPNPKV